MKFGTIVCMLCTVRGNYGELGLKPSGKFLSSINEISDGKIGWRSRDLCLDQGCGDNEGFRKGQWNLVLQVQHLNMRYFRFMHASLVYYKPCTKIVWPQILIFYEFQLTFYQFSLCKHYLRIYHLWLFFLWVIQVPGQLHVRQYDPISFHWYYSN